MRKIYFFILLFNFLFSYELYVNKKSDYLALKNIGILCEKNNNGYLCAKSDNLDKIKKLQQYIKTYGIDAKVVDNSSIKSGYCIQLLSSPKKDNLIKEYEKTINFPYARIEKIGNFYVLRVGESENIKDLSKIKNKLKKDFKTAFIRKCDLIYKRIVKSNFNKENTKKETKIKTENLTNKEKLDLIKKLIEKKEFLKALALSKNLQKSIYRKKAIYFIGLINYNLGNYKKSCNVLSDLSSIYPEKKFIEYKNKSCYKFWIQKAAMNIYVSPYAALKNLFEAKKYGSDDTLKKYLALTYINLKNYKKAYLLFKDLYKKYPNDKIIVSNYINTLFNLGKFNELNKIKYNKNYFQRYNLFKEAKKYYKQKEFDKAYENIEKFLKLYPESKCGNILMSKIYNSLNRPDYAMMYLQNVINLYGVDIETLQLMKKIYYNQSDIFNAYDVVQTLNSMNVKEPLDLDIKKDYFLYKAFKALKNCNYNLAKSYIDKAASFKNDIDVYDMKGEYYLKIGKFNEAYKNYKNIFLLSPNEHYAKILIDILFKENNIQKAKSFAYSQSKHIQDYFNLKLAKMYLDEGDYIKANKIIDNISNRNNNEYFTIKGIVCYYLSNYTCALDLLKKSLPSKIVDFYIIKTYAKISKQKAKNLLNKFLKKYKIYNKNEIAGIFIEIGEVKKAKEILDLSNNN